MKTNFNKEILEAGRRNENRKKSAGNFFTSKSVDKNGNESEMFFDKFSGIELKVVGTQVMPKNGDIESYNVVCFDNGAVLSTSRFFTARGLRWPVGGNAGKWDYLNACLVNGTDIKVSPDHVTTRPGKTTDGRDFDIVTYYFNDAVLPNTDMSVLNEKEESGN